MSNSDTKRDVTVIKDNNLSSLYESRFVIVDKTTGEVLDNAQGYGYKTPQKAYAAWNYKNRDKKKNKEAAKKRKAIILWLNEHKEFTEAMETYCFEITKGSWGPEEKFNAAFVQRMLKDFHLEPDFTAGEILRVWEKSLR